MLQVFESTVKKYLRVPDSRPCISSAIGLCSTACNFINFVSIVVKTTDNTLNIALKKLFEFGIDYFRGFCVILLCRYSGVVVGGGHKLLVTADTKSRSVCFILRP